MVGRFLVKRNFKRDNFCILFCTLLEYTHRCADSKLNDPCTNVAKADGHNLQGVLEEDDLASSENNTIRPHAFSRQLSHINQSCVFVLRNWGCQFMQRF